MEPRSILDAAASSPDQTVRKMALRRLAINQEAERIDNFLALYAEAATDKTISSDKPAKQAAVKSPPSGAKRGRKPQGDDKRSARLADEVCRILTSKGEPMKLPELFEALSGSDLRPGKVESLRARLYEYRSRIVPIRDKGYWLAPTTDTSSEGIAHAA